MTEWVYAFFWRPITDKEMKIVRDYAPTEIYESYGDTENNKKYGFYKRALYEELMRSFNENIPCVNGKYWWWQYAIGSDNPYFQKDDALVFWFKNVGTVVELPQYNKLLPIKNHYFTKNHVCKNRRQLRKYLGKQYFQLSETQRNEISKFFREYKGGIITF